MGDSDDRMVGEFRANGGVVVGAGGGIVLLHVGAPPRRVVPVTAALEGGSWVASAASGVEDRDWADDLRERPDAVVETASGSLDVLAIELDDEERSALRAAVAGPAFRLEPQG